MTSQHDEPTRSNNEPRLEVISDSMIKSLDQTKPWVGFLAIIGFVVAGLMAILGLLIILGFKEMPRGLGFMLFMGFLYFLMALLYFFPSVYLYNYSCSIERFIKGGGAKNLEEALSNQKSFWKFVGIYMIVSLGLLVLMFLATFLLSLMR